MLVVALALESLPVTKDTRDSLGAVVDLARAGSEESRVWVSLCSAIYPSYAPLSELPFTGE